MSIVSRTLTLQHTWRARAAGALACLSTVLGAAAAPQTAVASNLSNVTIQEIAIDPAYGNFIFIRLSSPPTGSPTCASTGHYWHFTFSLTGTAHSELYAALLAAQLSGKLITITGVGACNEHNTIESLRGINVHS